MASMFDDDEDEEEQEDIFDNKEDKEENLTEVKNEDKKKIYVYFEGIIKAKTDKWYLVEVEKPEEAKGLEIGMPISQIKGNPTNFVKNDKIMGEVLSWVIKNGIKETRLKIGENIEDILVKMMFDIEMIGSCDTWALENKMDEISYRMSEIEDKNDRNYHLLLEIFEEVVKK